MVIVIEHLITKDILAANIELFQVENIHQTLDQVVSKKKINQAFKLFLNLLILIKTMKNYNNILGLTSTPLSNGNGYAVQPRYGLSSDINKG